MMLAVKYSIFATLATLTNILFQWLCFIVYSGIGSLYAAMFIGTLAGLVAKYILDKKWIFYHTSQDRKDDAKKFILYSLMGIFTTIIFWGVEIGFYYVLSGPNAKYIGAIIGLSIGYTIKYFLDKKYVFVQEGKTAP